jgi:hypothetical protein
MMSSPSGINTKYCHSPLAKAHAHFIHPDLKTFISTGELKRDSPAFVPAFESLCNTTAAENFDVSQFPQDILVTADFSKTVQTQKSRFVSDFYQKPVQWILAPVAKGFLESEDTAAYG